MSMAAGPVLDLSCIVYCYLSAGACRDVARACQGLRVPFLLYLADTITDGFTSNSKAAADTGEPLLCILWS